MIFSSNHMIAVVPLLSLALVCGCGNSAAGRPPLGKVKGTVTYKGQPVPNVTVTFMMEKAPRAGTGVTNDAGEFWLSTYDTDDGAIVGTHKVTVSQSTSVPGGAAYTATDLANNGPPPPPKGGVIPGKYADPNTTPLKNTVEKGQNTFTLELRD